MLRLGIFGLLPCFYSVSAELESKLTCKDLGNHVLTLLHSVKQKWFDIGLQLGIEYDN